MNWSRFAIVALSALVIFLVFFPGVAVAIQKSIAAQLGDNLADALGVITGVLSIIYLLFNLGRWTLNKAPIRRVRGNETSPSEEQGTQTVQDEDAERKRELRGRAQELARRTNQFQHDRQQRNPFTKASREGGIPSDQNSPEYREITAQYNQHMDETLQQYQRDLLPELAQVRAELINYDIRDSEFDRFYGNPTTYDDIRTVSERLWEMAGRLGRSTQI